MARSKPEAFLVPTLIYTSQPATPFRRIGISLTFFSVNFPMCIEVSRISVQRHLRFRCCSGVGQPFRDTTDRWLLTSQQMD